MQSASVRGNESPAPHVTNDPPAEAPDARRQVQEVLLGCLQAVAVPWWPGSDSLTVEEVLRAYPQAAAVGLVPGLEQLQARHPDLAEELGAFFPLHQAGAGVV